MNGTDRSHRSRMLTLAVLGLLALPALAQTATGPGKDDPRAIHLRRIHPPEPAERIDWAGRITELLKEEPGDLHLTAVGDLIFNQPITHLQEPERAGLFRILQEADVAYGNMEFSLNDRPELQRPFYNFRAPRDFRWELARTGINLVSQANNHALDFGPEGLKECLQALDQANITHAGAGATLAEAHALGKTELAGHRTTVGLLAYMRYWTAKYRSKDPNAPSLSTIDPAVILVAKDGKVEKVEGPLESDVAAMEDDILLARRKTDLLLVSLHNHDVTHHRAFGIQDRTPPNEEIMFRRAIEAGADMVLGTGPHVLRGIEIYKGRPIFYSLGDFIYQYRTPDRIPADLLHQRDIEMPRPTNVSVWDRRESREVLETVLVRMTLNQGRLKRIQLLPVTIDDEGALYGVPRLASTKRGTEIIARIQKLSEPYGTKIVSKGWYAEVVLP
ncbi:MAG: CapA family protein [Holophagaceae bacterium]|uniref:CapA family protein n=1 Tax=Candidatus Geothrix skivensis TaxID=2954439 RepID=A0A9D7SJQ9_9BACT|nr:CapA family protein [Candidatus Geothrix skivensis]